jgi:Tol biopolymer transport system component
MARAWLFLRTVGNYDTWELNLTTGSLRQAITNPANDFLPAYSPDNLEIAFVSDRKAAPGVYAISTAGVELLLAAAKGAVRGPSWG